MWWANKSIRSISLAQLKRIWNFIKISDRITQLTHIFLFKGLHRIFKRAAPEREIWIWFILIYTSFFISGKGYYPSVNGAESSTFPNMNKSTLWGASDKNLIKQIKWSRFQKIIPKIEMNCPNSLIYNTEGGRGPPNRGKLRRYFYFIRYEIKRTLGAIKGGTGSGPLYNARSAPFSLIQFHQGLIGLWMHQASQLVWTGDVLYYREDVTPVHVWRVGNGGGDGAKCNSGSIIGRILTVRWIVLNLAGHSDDARCRGWEMRCWIVGNIGFVLVWSHWYREGKLNQNRRARVFWLAQRSIKICEMLLLYKKYKRRYPIWYTNYKNC